MLEWPARLPLARLPTPVTRIERFPGLPDGVEVWFKRDDLTGTEVTGNKIRKLEFCLAEARAQGCTTIITCGGVQSNHCRATAILGARLGLRVHLLLRGEQPRQPQGNLLLDTLSGAKISYLSQAHWHRHTAVAEALQADYQDRGEPAYFIPVGASDAVGLWGYIAASAEIKRDLERLDLQPDVIVTATGSGGTQAGLIVGAQLFSLGARIVAFNVSDDAAYFDRKIREDVTLWKQRYKTEFDVDVLTIDTIEGYLGPGYGVATQEVYDTIATLARSDGIFLDPVYTGKAFYGMVNELRKGSAGALSGASKILFVHTGGLFGLFAHHDHFGFDQSAPGDPQTETTQREEHP